MTLSFFPLPSHSHTTRAAKLLLSQPLTMNPTATDVNNDMIISPHPNEMLHSPPPPIHHMSNYYPLYENTPATPNDLDFSLLEHEFTDLCNVDEGYASWERNDQSPIEKALSEGFTCGTTFDWIHNEVPDPSSSSSSGLLPQPLVASYINDPTPYYDPFPLPSPTYDTTTTTDLSTIQPSLLGPNPTSPLLDSNYEIDLDFKPCIISPTTSPISPEVSPFGELIYPPPTTTHHQISRHRSQSSISTVSSFASDSTVDETTLPLSPLDFTRSRSPSPPPNPPSACSDTQTVYLFINENEKAKPAGTGPKKPPTTKSTLSKTEQNSFKCVCGKLFKKLYNLKNHYKLHQKEKPFGCEVCGRGFMRKHDLKRHSTTHLEGFKPFECGDCGTTFTRLDALHRHIKAKRCKAV